MQGTQPGNLWWPRGVEWGGREAEQGGGVYNQDWFSLMYSSDHHNIVKQVPSNKKKNTLLKKE